MNMDNLQEFQERKLNLESEVDRLRSERIELDKKVADLKRKVEEAERNAGVEKFLSDEFDKKEKTGE